MKTAEKIKKLFCKSNVTVGSKVDEKILSDTLNAFEKSIASDSVDYRPNIWTIIMQSKMTKFAAAAVIIIAVIVVINRFNVSVDMASTTFANVREEVSKAGWMHLTEYSDVSDGERIKSEVWISAEKQVVASKCSDLSIATWLDYTNGQRQIYKAEANELTLMGLAEINTPSEVAICDYLNLLFENEMLTETEIKEYMKVIDGVTFRVYDLHTTEGAGTCYMRIITDIRTNLPISIVFKPESSSGENSSVAFKCEYIDAGPENIYTLGVPLNAKVIDMLPSLGMKELAEIFNRKRERFSPYVFICVEPSQCFLYINHIKGDTFDAAKYYKYVHHGYWIPNGYNICDEIEGRAFEFTESLHKRSDAQLLSASLWDGKKLHRIDCVDWSVSKSIEPGNIRSVGHFWPISGLADKIIEDDYSKSHNLVAIKTGRILRYFDPLHDYVCVRYEGRIEDRKVLLRELTDLVQTEEGYWYPRREKGIVIEFDENGEEISREQTFEHMYYVERMEDLPKEFFDAEDNISRILKRN